MESVSKHKHSLPFKANISKQMHSFLYKTLRYYLIVILLLVAISIEAYFIIIINQKSKPIFHVLLIILSYYMIFILKQYYYLSKAASSVYLVDFSCFKPPSFCRVPFSAFVENVSLFGNFENESVTFMSKILDLSGLSEETCLPPALHYIPPKQDQAESIKEVQMVLFPVMEDILTKTNTSATDIDILIVNCSGFCPSPSLSSIIVNKFSMRSDVKSYNLSGMGCSASAIAVDLAQNLLKVHKNFNAIVLSTEILSTGWYSGNDKSKMSINCLFRMGSAAILLTNKQKLAKSAKYKLVTTITTQRAFNDKAYNSAMREEDSKGILGVTIKRDILQAVGETLRSNLSILGAQILPFTEKLRYEVSVIRKKFLDKSEEIYMPNFKTVIQHFCLPTSGKQMITEIGKRLKLSERDKEAALMTFKRFGNQSSSALWYELAYLEAKGRVKKGDRVWLVGLGTGIKCNSAVWECVRPIMNESKTGPWADCIDRYPTTIG